MKTFHLNHYYETLITPSIFIFKTILMKYGFYCFNSVCSDINFETYEYIENFFIYKVLQIIADKWRFYCKLTTIVQPKLLEMPNQNQCSKQKLKNFEFCIDWILNLPTPVL